jgi:hypothetical protein
MIPTSYTAAVEAALSKGQFLPRSQAPTGVKGSFNRTIAVFTIARKGRVTPVGVSQACTREGDKPSPEVAIPAAPRVAVVVDKSGNGGSICAYIYG